MQEIVINRLYHGIFGISEDGLRKYAEYAGIDSGIDDIDEDSISRDDPILVRVVRELGEKASQSYSNLEIVAIPDGVKWIITGTESYEVVAEVHRTWE